MATLPLDEMATITLPAPSIEGTVSQLFKPPPINRKAWDGLMNQSYRMPGDGLGDGRGRIDISHPIQTILYTYYPIRQIFMILLKANLLYIIFGYLLLDISTGNASIEGLIQPIIPLDRFFLKGTPPIEQECQGQLLDRFLITLSSIPITRLDRDFRFY